MKTLIDFHMFEVLGLTPSREEIPQKTKPFHVLVKIFFLGGVGFLPSKTAGAVGPTDVAKAPEVDRPKRRFMELGAFRSQKGDQW
jgi:hypothetical protein